MASDQNLGKGYPVSMRPIEPCAGPNAMDDTPLHSADRATALPESLAIAMCDSTYGANARASKRNSEVAMSEVPLERPMTLADEAAAKGWLPDFMPHICGGGSPDAAPVSSTAGCTCGRQ